MIEFDLGLIRTNKAHHKSSVSCHEIMDFRYRKEEITISTVNSGIPLKFYPEQRVLPPKINASR